MQRMMDVESAPLESRRFGVPILDIPAAPRPSCPSPTQTITDEYAGFQQYLENAVIEL